MTDPRDGPSPIHIELPIAMPESMTNPLDRPISYRPGDIRIDRNGRYQLDFAALGRYNNYSLRPHVKIEDRPVEAIREIPKDIGIHWRRFDNTPAQRAVPDFVYIVELFAGVRWDRSSTRDRSSNYELGTVDERQRTMDDRRFAILAHTALQTRPDTFEKLLVDETRFVPISTDVRFVASSSRGMQKTMILRYNLRILAGQWIVRLQSSTAIATTTANDTTESDRWIGLTPDGIKIHSLDEWIELTHDRTFVQLLCSDDREYDIIQMESTIGKWASFEKIATGADNTVGFSILGMTGRRFEENFKQASPEKQFPGAMEYIRDKAHPLHNVVFKKVPFLEWREHCKYTATPIGGDTSAKTGKDVDSSEVASSEQNTPRLVTEKDLLPMTQEEAKRQEYRDRLRARQQRKKQTKKN